MSSTDHKAPCYVVFSTPLLRRPLRLKYLPQHHVLKHLQSERPSFTPIQHKSKITILYILTLCISIEFIFEKVNNRPYESQFFQQSLVLLVYKCEH